MSFVLSIKVAWIMRLRSPGRIGIVVIAGISATRGGRPELRLMATDSIEYHDLRLRF